MDVKSLNYRCILLVMFLLKYFLLFSIKTLKHSSHFSWYLNSTELHVNVSLTQNKTQSTSSSNPDKVVLFLPALVFISTSGKWNVKLVLSFASFCLRIISVFTSILCPFVPKCSLSVILAYPQPASPQSRNKRILCFFAPLPHNSENKRKWWCDWKGNSTQPASKFQCHKGHNLFSNFLSVEKQATGFYVQPRFNHPFISKSGSFHTLAEKWQRHIAAGSHTLSVGKQ